jgi:hypothetical protein
MGPDSTVQLRVVEEKLRALATMMRHERDLEKLKFYKREFDLLGSELRRLDEALDKRPNAKLLPFAPKKPVRFA